MFSKHLTFVLKSCCLMTNFDHFTQTVTLYNYLKENTISQEYRLIEEEVNLPTFPFMTQVGDLDSHLALAETGLNWNSEELAGTLENIRRRVADLNTRVKKAQGNITLIQVVNDFCTFIAGGDKEMGGFSSSYKGRGGTWSPQPVREDVQQVSVRCL